MKLVCEKNDVRRAATILEDEPGSDMKPVATKKGGMTHETGSQGDHWTGIGSLFGEETNDICGKDSE